MLYEAIILGMWIFAGCLIMSTVVSNLHLWAAIIGAIVVSIFLRYPEMPLCVQVLETPVNLHVF